MEQQMNRRISLTPQPTISKTQFFLLWLAVHLVSWAAWLAIATIPSMLTTDEVLGYLSFFIAFSGMGYLQWQLLKRFFSIAWYAWIIPTTVGVALGMYGLIWATVQDHYMAFSPPGTPILEWDPLLGGALLGLALGCLQSIVWWPRLNRLVVWIVVNVLGWSLGMFLPQLVPFLLKDMVAVNSAPLLASLFPVAFAAVVTGAALVWFLGEGYGLD